MPNAGTAARAAMIGLAALLVAAAGTASAVAGYQVLPLEQQGLRSLRLHQCAARRLACDPTLRGVVRDRLRKLREVNPHGRVYHDRWEALLDGPLPALLRTITATSEQAEALRRRSTRRRVLAAVVQDLAEHRGARRVHPDQVLLAP